MAVTLDNWHRIEKLVKWTGLSVNAFARNIGLNRGENLYQIKRGNNGISKELADLISAKYANVSKAWVLTGEGEMFIDDSQLQNCTVPCFKMDVIQYLQSPEQATPTYHISVPMFAGCDFAAITFATAMDPEIPAGSLVVCKKADSGVILPGENYLLESSLFTGIRCIRKDPDSTKLRLVPRNKENYDDVIIELSEVRQLYLIKGIIINKSI